MELGIRRSTSWWGSSTVQHEPERGRVESAGLLPRRTDQVVIGCSVLFCLVAMGIYFVQQGGMRGQLIEIERIDPPKITFRLNINQAAWPELTQLPQVGETLARRIVAHRQRHGSFGTLQDLKEVEGIGPKTLARLMPYLLPLEAGEQDLDDQDTAPLPMRP